MKNKKLVIIGGDAAGMSAASKARRLDPNLQIKVFEKGEYVSYSACGFPYYIGGITESRDKLLVRTPKQFEERNINVFLRHEAIAVDFKEKTIKIKNLENNDLLKESYDFLLIATGAEPITIPFPGIYLQNIYKLRTLPDADKIKEAISNENIKDVVLVGGGFINLEIVDVLTALGKNIRVIERNKTLLNNFDSEFGEMVKKTAEKHGAIIHTGESVEEFIGKEKVEKVRTDKGEYKADIVIMALGIKPSTNFIKESRINMLENGAIIVDEKCRTSIQDVYAAGDCASIYHKVKKENVYIPLGTNANKQGRVVGSIIGGETLKFQGILGTSILKFLDMTFAMTGITEKEAKKIGVDYGEVTIETSSHAGTYPGAEKITIKLIYDNTSHEILGAQLAGKTGVDGRIDVFALAIDKGITAEDIGIIDFAYSPPYATPWDPVAIAANVVK